VFHHAQWATFVRVGGPIHAGRGRGEPRPRRARAGGVSRGCRQSGASERPWGCARVGWPTYRDARGPASVTNGPINLTPYSVRGWWCDSEREVTVRTHCPDPAACGGGDGSGQAPSWHPELAAYRCFFRPDGVHRAPPHEDSHHRRHHPPLVADGHRPQACVQARITRISSAGHRERPP